MGDKGRHLADEQFRLLFEAAPNGAMIEKLFGYTRDELIGRSIELLMPARFRTAHKVFRDEFDHQMRPMGARPYLYGLRKDGSEFPVEIGLNPITSDGISIAQQTGRRSDSLEDFQKRFEGRLLAMAHSLDVLVAKSWTGASVEGLVQAQLKAFVGVESQISADGPPIMLKPDPAQSIGLALHELATNATKYGALSSPQGRVVIRWDIDEARTSKEFYMSWREEGGPLVTKPTREGFGYQLLTRAAEVAGGHPRLSFSPEGLAWTVHFPADRVVSQ
jgi:two-component sensor histidine kinase